MLMLIGLVMAAAVVLGLVAGCYLVLRLWKRTFGAVKRLVPKISNVDWALDLIAVLSFFGTLIAAAGVSAWCLATGSAVSVEWFSWTLCFPLKLVLLLTFASCCIFSMATMLTAVDSGEGFVECFCVPGGLLCGILAVAFFTTSSLHFVKSDRALAEEQQVQQMREKYAELAQEEL